MPDELGGCIQGGAQDRPAPTKMLIDLEGAHVSYVSIFGAADHLSAEVRWRQHHWRLGRLQRPEHNQRINIPKSGVPEGKRQSAYDVEAQRLPEVYGMLVRADDEIELHCAKAAQPGEL